MPFHFLGVKWVYHKLYIFQFKIFDTNWPSLLYKCTSMQKWIFNGIAIIRLPMKVFFYPYTVSNETHFTQKHKIRGIPKAGIEATATDTTTLLFHTEKFSFIFVCYTVLCWIVIWYLVSSSFLGIFSNW